MSYRQWVYDNFTIVAMNEVFASPGIWTARLCRTLNELPETEESIIHCGLCSDYANPRKRERARRLARQPTLPGWPLGRPYQLHEPCRPFNLKRLQGILRKLRDVALMVRSERDRIPDTRNIRGWDWATRWYPIH
jgi:hypothetical protein